MINAHEIRIDSDENGFEMTIETDDGTIRLNIHGVAFDLYDAVRREIGPWVREAELARATMPAPAEECGYDLGDPKSPGYHGRMSAIYDNREGK